MGTQQVRFWNVPYRRNPYFTGREALLIRLHELLCELARITIFRKRCI